MSKKSTIGFGIELDENHIPEKIDWKASDNGQGGDADAVMLNIWDKNEKNTLRIDLWTKDMSVDDMKKFMFQSMLTMADTFARATGEEEAARAMREFAKHFGEKMEVIDPEY